MRVLLAAFLGIASVLPLAGQTRTRTRRDKDETAIRAVVKKYVDARERADARAIEALFTSDADQLVSSGIWRKGREEVVRGTVASSENTGGTRPLPSNRSDSSPPMWRSSMVDTKSAVLPVGRPGGCGPP